MKVRLALAALGLTLFSGFVGAACAAQDAHGNTPVAYPVEVDLGNGNHVVCVVSANPYHPDNGGGVDCNWKPNSP